MDSSLTLSTDVVEEHHVARLQNIGLQRVRQSTPWKKESKLWKQTDPAKASLKRITPVGDKADGGGGRKKGKN